MPKPVCRHSTLCFKALAPAVALLASIGAFVVAEIVWHPIGTDRTPQDWVYGELLSIEAAINVYRLETGSLPQSLKVLESRYLQKPPFDRWGHALVYRVLPENGSYILYSLGRNGVDESGGGDDITTEWKKFTCEQYAELCWTSGQVIWLTSLVTGLLSAFSLLGIGAISAYRHFRPRRA